MKTKTIFILLFTVLAWTSVAQNEGDFTVPLSDPTKPGKLYVNIKTGSVIIKGTARKDVLVKYTRNSDEDDNDQHSNSKNREGLKRISSGALDIEASEYQNTVKVVSENWNDGVGLSIEIPNTMNVEAMAYNDGEVEISNITGNLELTNYNGGITATAISGTVVAQTYNGDIKITFDKITPDAPMSFVNYNGDIDITFPATLKASMKVKTKQGEIYTAFDGAVQKSNPVTKSDSKTGVYKVNIDDWTKIDINGGGPEFTMKSYNGDLYIRKK
jgi:DUF4097 and DUF4098 domain-containing protein YvlB